MSQHSTPLRYPGGKQKLEPFIREVIDENGLRGGFYVEPYAGGAGVGIQLLVDGVVSGIHLNDSWLFWVLRGYVHSQSWHEVESPKFVYRESSQAEG